jgi:hypothetical protein
MVEIEGDLLVPFGSNMTFVELELDEEVEVPIADEVEVALELGTVPIVFAVPIG